MLICPAPRATFTLLSCTPNFPHPQLDRRVLSMDEFSINANFDLSNVIDNTDTIFIMKLMSDMNSNQYISMFHNSGVYLSSLFLSLSVRNFVSGLDEMMRLFFLAFLVFRMSFSSGRPYNFVFCTCHVKGLSRHYICKPTGYWHQNYGGDTI